MKRSTVLLAVLLLAAAPARAQDLSGHYVYAAQGGTVTLELRQSGASLTGVMTGLDGSVNQLNGTFEGAAASGSIQTRSGTGWFAAGASGDGLTLVVAALDPATGEPDLDNGWQLDFTRTDAAAGRGAAGAAAQPSPRAGGAMSPQPASSTPLVREWMGHLSGKKITYIDSYSSGGSGYSSRWEAYLCSDGSFHFRSSSSMSADVGGVFGNSSGGDSFSGAWRIVEHNGQALLQYQRAEQAGTDQGEWVALGYQNGQTFFDGERVYVTDDNPMCR